MEAPDGSTIAEILGIFSRESERFVLKKPSLIYADRMIGMLVEEAKSRWPIEDLRVLHRVGELEIGEAAVAIAVSSAHRAEAFSACRFTIEEIKKRVPIWKKEIFEDGTREWVVCPHAEMEAVS
mgnify:CR=1 FL=1